MNNRNHSSNRYFETSVTTSSPEQLVVLLYEAAIRHLKQAITNIEDKDLNGKRQSVDRAMAIVQHLQSTLDMERGGQISLELDRLYTYVVFRILDGSAKLTVGPLEEAVKLLSSLLEAWREVAKQKQGLSLPAKSVVGVKQAPSMRLQLQG